MNKTIFYTGKGDRGDTARLGGEGRLSKADVLLVTIGTIDEATAAIGMARAMSQVPDLKAFLTEVQRRLYRMMSHISASPESRERYPGLTDTDVAWLEAKIETVSETLPDLNGFVIPGDTPAGAAFHVARTVTRRAERQLVAFVEREPNVGAANLAFMNRLSSLMFVAALHEDTQDGGGLTLARPG
jgi:cob(I)alamin adenosyltransferase